MSVVDQPVNGNFKKGFHMITSQVNDRRPSIEQPSTVTNRRGRLTAMTTMLLFGAMVLTGCGDSGDSETSAATNTDDTSEQSTSVGDAGDGNNAADSNDAADGEDAADNNDAANGNDEWDDADKPWRSDDVEYGAVATGLKVALSADRVEVEGTTFHVYLEENARIPGGPCLVINSTLPDGATAIVYQDGEETTC